MNPDPSRTILIAEDEPFLLKTLAITFEQAGFQVLRAADGETALQMATTYHPKVSVLDIMMPKMDGLTVLQRIRQDALWGKNAIVIMLTNLTADSQMLQAMAQNPPSYYFVKDTMDPDQLMVKVQEILASDASISPAANSGMTPPPSAPTQTAA